MPARHDPLPQDPRFQILGRLGVGAHGTVFEGIDRARGTKVAIKVPHRATDEAALRLRREFHALRDVRHPNLVRPGELIEDGGRSCFTMEAVDGVCFLTHVRGAAPSTVEETMQLATTGGPGEGERAVAEGRLDSDRLRDALRQLAGALSALHAAGKVHRDVKSSNVLVTRAGRVVLVDFGLVADLGEPSDEDDAALVVGTPPYMSPEQTLGERATPASDWYSFGALLYTALTGHPPHQGSTAEVLRAKRHLDPLSPSTVAPGVPADLEALCLALLRRVPSERPDGAEVRARLGMAAASSSGSSGSPAGSSGSPAGPALLASCSLGAQSGVFLS